MQAAENGKYVISLMQSDFDKCNTLEDVRQMLDAYDKIMKDIIYERIMIIQSQDELTNE